jgi:trans-2,3-dihydro-3-hydroxyanthranilate isomerase
MGRPSTLACRINADGGRVSEATVTGSVVPIARGEIIIPD